MNDGLKEIVVASGNRGKIKEILKIFSDATLKTMREAGFEEDVEETGETFAENAYIKAKAVCDALNKPALADDSGLCVDALDGAPGLYSARYSGGGDKENRKLLLKNLDGITDRGAHFECTVCLCMPDGRVFYGKGATYGRILESEEGSNGFGYDPLFFSDDLQKSFGNASDEEKNSVSHRYRALCDLKSKL
ncbi:MAG: RdgB/HAM1 family non-canonical purine NTP pyrophosphatase [Candidatus Coproplasma sp.]